MPRRLGLPLLEGLPQRLGPPELLGWVGKPGHKVAELVPQGAVVYVSWWWYACCSCMYARSP